MDAYAVIASNHPWSGEFNENSFRALLYEEGIWSQGEYWKLEWAPFQLVNVVTADQEVLSRVFRLYSATFILFMAHFDSNDSYVIRNIGNEKIRKNIERFQLVFEGFFAGDMPDLAAGFDESNPLLIPKEIRFNC